MIGHLGEKVLNICQKGVFHDFLHNGLCFFLIEELSLQVCFTQRKHEVIFYRHMDTIVATFLRISLSVRALTLKRTSISVHPTE